MLKFKNSNFIDEGEATIISLILRAFQYKIKGYKGYYNKRYPKLSTAGKKFVDQELKKLC